ncbi:hypothetical protein KJ953_02665 [Patescibacteria group bacterium]|nr:hypothetical protein [Patescibacteria group bacterium]MBU1256101.1 hypothetical protein [Patescibacteria group bacterium]MBU1457230.1 hypothetical protein [Patescibacteria group bacterium]
MKKLFLGSGLLLIFLLLILFNQKKAQREIFLSQTPVYKIALVKLPLNASANEPVEFVWNITAPDTATTPTTTIYYSPISSPSALTIKDSPSAVGYSNWLTDYLSGNFFLPDTFSATASFLKGTIFYRAYAKVGDQHLWSEEIKLTVN